MDILFSFRAQKVPSHIRSRVAGNAVCTGSAPERQALSAFPFKVFYGLCERDFRRWVVEYLLCTHVTSLGWVQKCVTQHPSFQEPTKYKHQKVEAGRPRISLYSPYGEVREFYRDRLALQGGTGDFP